MVQPLSNFFYKIILQSTLYEESAAAKALYEQSIQDHNDMINTLKECKAMIARLAATSFL